MFQPLHPSQHSPDRIPYIHKTNTSYNWSPAAARVDSVAAGSPRTWVEHPSRRKRRDF